MNKDKVLFQVFMGLLFLSYQPYVVYANYIGAYSVANHEQCHGSNIPNTAWDTSGFLSERPSWINRNFYFADDDVWSSDWRKDRDFYSASTGNGYNGADASLISYISTHGGNSWGDFSMSTGLGCTVSSSEMLLGDNRNRYLFLSTCQSLKLGDGEDPKTEGENPNKTWSASIDGVRCILGYSNNSLDSKDYGRYFWQRWKKEGVKTSIAFMDASWAIYKGQIPVVACWGKTKQQAIDMLDETHFYSTKAIKNWVSWRWYDKATGLVKFETNLLLQSEHNFPLRIRVFRPSGPENFLDVPFNSNIKTEKPVDVPAQSFVRMPYGFDYWDHNESMYWEPMSLTNDEVISIAKSYLDTVSLIDGSVVGVEIREEGLGDKDSSNIVAKTVIFKHGYNGIPFLGDNGEVRVTINGRGKVQRVSSSLYNVDTSNDPKAINGSDLHDLITSAEQSIEEKAKTRWGNYEYELLSIETGYAVHGEKPFAEMTVRAIYKVSDETFVKLHQIDEILN